MPDNDLKPMNDHDVTSTTADVDFTPAAPLKDQGVAFEAEGATIENQPQGRTEQAKQALRENTAKVKEQATDKFRAYADDGKSRGAGALEQLSKMLTDAAGQVDDKLGGQYGQYARSAADQVQGLADTVRNKDVDELVDDVRGFVKASPAAAIGIAAALGFAVARLAQAGLDAPSDTDRK
jgi:ElaB/YqjD/DUF883 family membrane-anchored ribosome-binding protein